MPDRKEADKIDYEILFDQKLPCQSPDCNNGCPIAKLVNHYRHRIGAVSITDSAPKNPGQDYKPALSRELSVEAMTFLDAEGEMIGDGILDFSGQKEVVDGEPNGHCNVKIVKKSNGNGEYFVPVLAELKRDLLYGKS